MSLRLFVGSSSEAIAICRAVQAELEDDDLVVTVWHQDVFRLNYGALDSLLEALDSSDAGVFVLRPDDLTTSRGESNQTVRDNVLFELGMFIGRLGRDRTFMMTPSSPAFHLPSDLVGLTTARYDAVRFDSGDERSAVGSACRRIRQAVNSIQVRMAPEPISQARLDRAMRRMSKDLEYLLSKHGAPPGRSETPPAPLGPCRSGSAEPTCRSSWEGSRIIDRRIRARWLRCRPMSTSTTSASPTPTAPLGPSSSTISRTGSTSSSSTCRRSWSSFPRSGYQGPSAGSTRATGSDKRSFSPSCRRSAG
jgi:hypothetical protein